MFDWGGVHLRHLGLRTTSNLEVIGMAALVRDEPKRQGVSLLAILGIPTKTLPGGHHGLGYLLGLTGRLVISEVMTLPLSIFSRRADLCSGRLIPFLPRWICAPLSVARTPQPYYPELSTQWHRHGSSAQAINNPSDKVRNLIVGFTYSWSSVTTDCLFQTNDAMPTCKCLPVGTCHVCASAAELGLSELI